MKGRDVFVLAGGAAVLPVTSIARQTGPRPIAAPLLP